MADVKHTPARYPLEIENIGEDVYILISRGHHDVHEFMRKVREDYDWPLGMPTHVYMKTRPSKDPDYRCFYDIVPEGTRGAWPATHTQEAWGENSYESQVGAARATEGSATDAAECTCAAKDMPFGRCCKAGSA